MTDNSRCAGGCGRTVSDPGKWCSACWPEDVSSKHVDQSDPIRPEPVKDSHQIREEILRNAYILKFGTEVQQSAALETIAHLTAVLRNKPPQGA